MGVLTDIPVLPTALDESAMLRALDRLAILNEKLGQKGLPPVQVSMGAPIEVLDIAIASAQGELKQAEQKESNLTSAQEKSSDKDATKEVFLVAGDMHEAIAALKQLDEADAGTIQLDPGMRALNGYEMMANAMAFHAQEHALKNGRSGEVDFDLNSGTISKKQGDAQKARDNLEKYRESFTKAAKEESFSDRADAIHAQEMVGKILGEDYKIGVEERRGSDGTIRWGINIKSKAEEQREQAAGQGQEGQRQGNGQQQNNAGQGTYNQQWYQHQGQQQQYQQQWRQWQQQGYQQQGTGQQTGHKPPAAEPEMLETLGINPGKFNELKSVDEKAAAVKSGYRQQAKAYHPDIHPELRGNAAAEQKMKDINASGQALMKKYPMPDSTSREQGQRQPSSPPSPQASEKAPEQPRARRSTTPPQPGGAGGEVNATDGVAAKEAGRDKPPAGPDIRGGQNVQGADMPVGGTKVPSRGPAVAAR